MNDMYVGLGLVAIIVACGVTVWFAAGGFQIVVHRCNCKHDKRGEE